MANNAKFEVEIFGNTAQFENSLKGINTAMSALKSEASSLRSALKLDPTNTTLMTKLQTNLGNQLEQTKNKTVQLKTELAGIDKSTPDGQAKFLKLSKAIQDSETRAGYLQRDIQSLDNSISSGSFNLKLKTDEAENGLSRVKSGFGGLKTIAIGALLEIGSKIATTIGGKFGDWVGGAVDTQKAMIALKNTMNFSGSGAEYDALSSRMQKLAQDTNANASDAIKLATTFAGLGNSSEVAGNKVDSLIRANQAFGGSSEDLKSVAQAYSQMSASGKVSAENINQLTDANTALGSALKTEIMKNPALASFGSFAEASEKGAVSVDMLDQAMANLGKAGGGGTTTIKDSFDSLDETISNALLPALDSITPIVVEIVNGIADSIPKVAESFKEMYTWIKQNWDWLSKVLIVIGSLVAIFGVLNAVITAFGIVMAVMMSPVALIVLAIVALIAIGVLLWKNWESIANFAKSIWGGIKGFFAGLGTWFGQLWQGITTAFQNAWNSVVSFLSGIVNGIKGFFSGLGTWFSELWTGITTTIQNVWNTITTTVQTVVTNIIAFFQPLTDFFVAIFGLIGAIIELAWQLILAGARAVWAGITTIFSAVVGFFTPIFQAVSQVVSSVFSAIGQFARNAWNFIVSIFSSVVSFYAGIFSAVSNVVSSVFSAIGQFAGNAWNRITSVFSAVGSWFSGIFSGVTSAVSNVFSRFGSFASNAWNSITSVFGNVGSWFSDIFDGIGRTVSNVFKGITDTIDRVTSTISGITDKVKGLFGGSTIIAQREFVDLKAKGLSQNSSSVENRYNNTFTINSGNQDPTAIARAVKREFELGRA